MEGGSEAFPDLGRHCQNPDCHQLDFLPFTCNACSKVFCLEHRSYKSHDCPKSDVNSRKVVVCEICSASIETTGHDGEDEKKILERHEKSRDCDPKKKKKPACPVRRCKEVLTFSNTATCKICQIKVCLKHRFPADHGCKPSMLDNNKFLVALAARNGKDCRKKAVPLTPSAPTVKAC
ncbi:Zinc finger AN1 domain-containing stress-associated protein 12 [Forsythia ovata]|uniref:Zinc finger AN1 domain-containing stress-associated protein 12 n=1 Tax=Forsythia ovata TaxID=205694 RepID=A0ABD1UEI2_9LAMI